MVRVPLTAAEIKRGQHLGAALRVARGARTMVDVASSASISVETLRKIETGRSPSPEFFTIARICSALGITTDELHVGLGEPAPDAAAC
ncbi:helix-turn-helix domain-containing protein [Rathayibacter soli]|uniref:helix-turn-helix domain-containing protein n=1 Tax=Rathayibacter soli TaxID=3144168 RepID=UPI0027E55334|nr:helix-turn-helix transcriptional regulator [Glaciibacter superstes]